MNLAKRLFSIMILLSAFFSLAPGFPVNAGEGQDKYAALINAGFQASVILPEKFDLSPALASLRGKASLSPHISKNSPAVLPKANTNSLLQPEVQQENLQPDTLLNGEMPEPLISFDGVSNLFGGWPPDTQGDIGPNHYVQWINLHLAIWQIDKAGMTAELVVGPLPGNTIFQGFGGACENTNDGDPITLYDSKADRWLMSQFALPNFPYGPFVQCIAVSQTGDPTGAWYRYAYSMPVNKMNDYPKFGVWPDAYYMTVNMYNAGSLTYGGAGVAAFEREAMLQGLPAAMVFFDLYNISPAYGGMLPADLDGLIDPPADSPGLFAEWDDAGWIGPQDAVRIWEFHVDWTQPENSTFGLSGHPNLVIPTSNVDPNMCFFQRECIPQPGTTRRIDAISDRLMYRLQYRNFGDYETLVANHTIDVNGGDWAGIHWFELRRGQADWALHQEGVFAPDSQHRWMGSAAMDHIGNLAIGYSISGASLYPSVRYAGRLSDDPLGTLPLAEKSLVEGSGSQTGSARWGDYSMLGVDPIDDCTFWYTQEYVASTGPNTWRTRIGAFRFPNCATSNMGVIKGQVTTSENGAAIPNAKIQAISGATVVATTLTNQEGEFYISVEEGTYQVAVSAYGFLPAAVSDLTVSAGQEVIQNFVLDLAGMQTVSGYVKDEQTGWPLYAGIKVIGTPLSTIWSDPFSGFYQVELPQGAMYSFQVDAWVDGYLSASIEVGPFDTPFTQDILLKADTVACVAPGYALAELAAVEECQVQSGGIIAGFVTDENTGSGILNAWVSDGLGNSAVSASTPGDPITEDGYYVLFSEIGSRTATAIKDGGYLAQAANLEVQANALVRQDFTLPAGLLAIDPVSIDQTLSMGLTQTVPLTLTNLGGVDIQYAIVELDPEPVSVNQELPSFVVKPFKQGSVDGSGLGIPAQPVVPLLDGGEMLASWSPAGSQKFWGLAYDGQAEKIWLSSPSAIWDGDDHVYDFSLSGEQGVRAFSHPMPHIYGPVDMTYNWNSGKLWIMNTDNGAANCIYEIDPVSGYTGRSICPGGGSGFSTSQRGLAYDPAGDTWFAGGWNDLMVYRFSNEGVILDAVYTGLAISGLAYNPDTGSLFALVSADPTLVYILDVENQYEITGMFELTDGFSAYAGAGLEIDCDGNLWAVDLVERQVHQFTSSETASICSRDVAWLSASPQSGVLPANSNQVISITLDARHYMVEQVGEYLARIAFIHDTPYQAPDLPVQLTVLPAVYGVELSADLTGEDIPGQMITYTISLTNTGLGVVDLYTIGITGNNWLTQVATNEIGPLDPGQTEQIVVSVQIPSEVMGGESDTAWIKANSQGDVDKTDTLQLTTTALLPQADVEVVKNVFSPSIYLGEEIPFTIQVTNHGPTKASQVTLIDVLSPDLVYHSNNKDCSLVDYVVVCELGMMEAGEVQNVEIWAIPGRLGTLVNQAVAILEGDPYLENNWSAVAFEVFVKLFFPFANWQF